MESVLFWVFFFHFHTVLLEFGHVFFFDSGTKARQQQVAFLSIRAFL